MLKDIVTNHNSNPQKTMLLYHINVGYPILDANSRLIANTKEVVPQSDWAKAEMDSVFVCEEPVAGKTEHCYAHDFYTNDEGIVKVAFVNDELELGLALEYKKSELPYFNQWKMLNTREYVVGLEPGNCLPVGIMKAEKNNMVETILPGEKKTYEIVFKILDGKEEIEKYEKEIFQNRR